MAIACSDLVVSSVFLAFPLEATHFIALVGVGWAYVDSVEDTGVKLVGCIGFNTKSGVGMEGARGVGGSKFHTMTPKVRLVKLNINIASVLTIPRGGNKKGT
jgi:hypothetical protein